MLRRAPLRKPKTPHDRGDRLVPYAHCGCSTCEGARADQEAAHWEHVGDVLGLDDSGGCACGRALDEDGRCLAGSQCTYAQMEHRR